MKASELRIGNYIADRGNKEWQIDHWESINKLSAKSNATMYMGILMETHPMTEYVDYIKPIPLTEEWLLKFGFEEITNYVFKSPSKQSAYELSYETLCYNLKEKIFTVCTCDVHGFETTIEHVHQLQNLYFALTGEELITKQ